MTDCVIENCGTGVKLGEGASVRSVRTRYINNGVSVDNAGHYEGHGDQFD